MMRSRIIIKTGSIYRRRRFTKYSRNFRKLIPNNISKLPYHFFSMPQISLSFKDAYDHLNQDEKYPGFWGDTGVPEPLPLDELESCFFSDSLPSEWSRASSVPSLSIPFSFFSASELSLSSFCMRGMVKGTLKSINLWILFYILVYIRCENFLIRICTYILSYIVK